MCAHVYVIIRVNLTLWITLNNIELTFTWIWLTLNEIEKKYMCIYIILRKSVNTNFPIVLQGTTGHLSQFMWKASWYHSMTTHCKVPLLRLLNIKTTSLLRPPVLVLYCSFQCNRNSHRRCKLVHFAMVSFYLDRANTVHMTYEQDAGSNFYL